MMRLRKYQGIKRARRCIPLALNRCLIDSFFLGYLVQNFLIYIEACQHVAVNEAGIQADLIRKIVKYGVLRRMAEQHGVGKTDAS